MADSAEHWLKQGDVTHAVALMHQAIAQYPERLQDWLVFSKALSQASSFVCNPNRLYTNSYRFNRPVGLSSRSNCHNYR